LILNEPNIHLFLNTQVFKVEKKENTIIFVTGKSILTGEESIFKGTLFADCTGDGDVGFLAGADYNMGRESKEETEEPRASAKPDLLVMGTSVQWHADDTYVNTSFPKCPWAVQFSEETCRPGMRGGWDWETGMSRNQITEIEFIRDYALRAVLGNWDYLKNKSIQKDLYANKKLSWVAYIGGKRESRRLLRNIILKEQDLLNHTTYEDTSFTTPLEAGMEEPPFLSYADLAC
jgi:hypothetical protein